MKKIEKPEKGETIFHTFFRFLSFHIVKKLLLNSSITPNEVTIFRAVVLLPISFWLFLKLDYWYILGFFIFQISELLDSVDGDLARLKNQRSKIGVWLEIFFDSIETSVWGVLGFTFAYISYKIDGNLIYFLFWGVIGFFVNLEKSFYIHFKGVNESLQDAKHNYIYFGFKGESLKNKIKNFLIVSKSWENQWLIFGGLIYVIFKINLLFYIWIWLIILNQIHWIRLAILGYKKALNG